MQLAQAEKIKLLVETSKKLLRRQAVPHLKNLIDKTHASDVALMLHHLDPKEKQAVFSFIKSSHIQADVLSEMEEGDIPLVLEGLETEKVCRIFKEMSSDDVADILTLLPEPMSSEILKLMEAAQSEEVEDLLQYEEDSAGGIMDPQFFALDENMTVGEAIQKLQEESSEQEMVFYIYVVNSIGQLVGVISLRQLLTVKPQKKLSEIMSTDVIRVTTHEDQEEVAKLVSQYNILAVPVVDENNKLVGIVTVDDVIDVMREEATEDILKMASVGNVDVLDLSSLKSVRARFPWLLASFLSGLVALSIIGKFQSTIGKMAVLSGFIPIILGMGGNVGTQTSAVIVRGLATGRVVLDQLWKVLFKELKVGGVLALLYGVVLGFGVQLISGEHPRLGIVVGTSLFLVMTIAAVLGAFLPIIFKKFQFDPALATGPFITTAIDVVSTLIFFNLVHLFLHI
ncbi:MAG: magnesium transporter [Deltaproteobacteria bacterium]|nr:magnesium transporter [Deltaproteobacteria bacterium]